MLKIERALVACTLLCVGCAQPTFSGAVASPTNADVAASPAPPSTGAAATRTRHVATKPKGDRPRGLMWGGFLTGAAGIATGAVTLGLAASSRSSAHDVEATCPQPGACGSQAQSDRDAATTQQTISYVGFGVGAVGLALGLADIFFFSKPVKQADVERRSREDETSAKRGPQWRVYATPTGGGIGGTFD